ncbi:saccharopine dehydrogenase family protein [Zestomonas carbonaria]|uniref:Trans-acting enoyl reductase n=1 Tax=Zestomonas carbonaria TaxID=2762745 RepID=A0A7U7IAZ4_9GAMM|nr:saccharopine dehydrogenase NADP-binding domain-containing protein [Pseudomonas carbonaria]CAD5109959.1 Putative trans-acting enoyl reductase [Pseudomonas carbonaria]
MKQTPEFDIIVYGASGYTGRLVAEYLSQAYGGDGELHWAMAGRDAGKLAAVRDEIGAPADTPLVVADTGDPASLRAMVENTRVVLTTVGPYQLYGEPLVAACAESGTDYVDLCGEPAWMRKMIDAYDETARRSDARIVFSCGFDSIPFDLGVFFLQQAARERFGVPLSRIKGRVRKMKGTFSGGTAASLKATLVAAKADPAILQLLTNPFALTPGFSGPAQPPAATPEYDEALGSWAAPFIMAAINTRNVHRSNFLLGHAYGEDFVYDEMLLTGPGEQGKAIAEAVASDRSLASDKAPKPGEGPSKEERESGFYDVLFIGETADGRTLNASVAGQRDPGYGSTSRMIAESALCLLRDATTTPGGIWTTAPAMGEKLIRRLTEHAGLTFRLEA